ncbi:MAG: fatty acid desaturase [Planctomycetaceae bacterium]
MSATTFSEQERRELYDPWQWTRFQFLPGAAVGIWALAVQFPSAHWGWYVGWTVLTSYCMFCWTSCFHETVHQTLTSQRGTSIWLGRFLGTLMFVPYGVYRESHIRHHAYLNKPYDWELWPYSDPQAGLWFRRVFVWLDFFFGAFTAMLTYGRIFFHKTSPIKDAQRKVVACEYIFAVCFWGVLFALFTLFSQWGGFVRGWLVPYMIAGMYQNGRKFTEHMGMSSYDPMHGTRTVVGQNWWTKLCTYLNFDIFIHGPHHRHPRVAHRKLREKMRDYVKSESALQYPMFRTYREAVRDMLPFLFRNPGVGMNAGADPPAEDKTQAANFVQDVVQEVLADSDREAAVAH